MTVRIERLAVLWVIAGASATAIVAADGPAAPLDAGATCDEDPDVRADAIDEERRYAEPELAIPPRAIFIDGGGASAPWSIDRAAGRLIDILNKSELATNGADEVRRLKAEWKLAYERALEALGPSAVNTGRTANWLEAISTHRSRSVFNEDSSRDDASKAWIIAKLEARRVKGLQFVDQNLDQVATYLRVVTGLDFQITPKTRTTKFDEVRITIPGLDDVSVKWLLDNVITTPYDLRWEPRDGVVTIAMKDEVAGTMRLKYFDVKTLVSPGSLQRESEIVLAHSSFIPPELDEPPPAPLFPTDPLVDSIRAAVDPESWTDEGGTIDLKHGTLIVKNRRRTIERVGVYLDQRRKAVAASVTSTTLAPVKTVATESPSSDRALEFRRWDVQDLVGLTSEFGAIAALQPGDAPLPFTAGALLGALRAVIPDEALARLYASLTLSEGIVSARLDPDSLQLVSRAVQEIRARTCAEGHGLPPGGGYRPTCGAYFNDGADDDFRPHAR